MDVCKCVIPLRHWSTLNRRRLSSSLVWLVKGEEMWKALYDPKGSLPLNWGGTEQNRTFTMMFKAKTNDRHEILTLSPDEFRRPGCDFISKVALATTS
ncbi:hypothetical protein TNCV_2420771 [Trichonephila clavipes]|uniref:Uncharacterized protein n=1 Tax=Trichonephila clavipes TaxID=2585209 RepID=A0A8X6V0B0_TRICX|nr:hypothetical protein TNCV_2420771 [Trichonephila clavipes]